MPEEQRSSDCRRRAETPRQQYRIQLDPEREDGFTCGSLAGELNP
jgi:hypothetical protein